MLTLNDGRSELWQWDTGRKLTVDADCSQVHFSNKVFGRSIDVDVVDGVAIIPDIMLQTDKDLFAWAFVGTAENGYTKISKTFKVNRRNKPADYVFTPLEQTTLGEIMERLDLIEESQDPDAIKNAVDDYLASNPIQVKETDPTVPDWAKQPKKPNYTAEEVGALPADTVIPEIPAIPSKLPNPHALTFTGAVEATYDGSKTVSVEIPQGGGSGEDTEFRLISTIDTGDTPVSGIIVTEDDEGNPFELEEAYILVESATKEYAYASVAINIKNKQWSGVGEHRCGTPACIHITKHQGMWVAFCSITGYAQSNPFSLYPYHFSNWREKQLLSYAGHKIHSIKLGYTACKCKIYGR